MKNIRIFLSENFHFFMVKFSVYLNRRVNVMERPDQPMNSHSLNRHYENTPIQIYRLFYHQKNGNFQIKNSDIFLISAQNIDRGYSLEPPRQGGSNEYQQSMFSSKMRKIMYTPVNPSFTIKKWGLMGSKLYRRVFVMGHLQKHV